jgi:DinB superfamily
LPVLIVRRDVDAQRERLLLQFFLRYCPKWILIGCDAVTQEEGDMNHNALIEQYLAGPVLLARAVAGMTREQLLARPIPGKWSTLEVVCHLADYEPIYADRMKRVLALKEPELLQGDPGLFASRLAYDRRDLDEELALIELTRKQMARILRSVKPEDFQRRGTHSRDGALTLEDLLRRIAGHIPHHIRFIEEKRRAMSILEK